MGIGHESGSILKIEPLGAVWAKSDLRPSKRKTDLEGRKDSTLANRSEAIF